MRYVILDWQKIYKTVLEKPFFFIFGVSIFFGSCVENFEKQLF
jgi:hypothetical protein